MYRISVCTFSFLSISSLSSVSSIYSVYSCTSGEIESVTKCLSSTKEVSLDGFAMKVIKYLIKAIYLPLSAAFNSSFLAGVFPDALKHAKVAPVIKSDKFMITNYRPISALLILTKTFEKLVYNRLISFISSSELLCDNQFGFRHKHSTYMALLNIIDQISASIDDGKYTIAYLLIFM